MCVTLDVNFTKKSIVKLFYKDLKIYTPCVKITSTRFIVLFLLTC
jgi:hypothetical protein